MEKQMEMKCGCMFVPQDRFDVMNAHGMECAPCVQKSFPWFAQDDPEKGQRDNWERVNGKWVFSRPERGAGHWAWVDADWDNGEQVPHMRFIKD